MKSIQFNWKEFPNIEYKWLMNEWIWMWQQRRNVAYLYAIHHGARHIFDAYPETYVEADVDVETFRKTMTHQLQNAALNVALGLVRERPYVKRVQNPYAHFGRPELWTEAFRRSNQRYLHNHIYRICEVRPPSIEKVTYIIIIYNWMLVKYYYNSFVKRRCHDNNAAATVGNLNAQWMCVKFALN